MKVKNILIGFVCVFAGNTYAGVTEGKPSVIFVHAFNDAVVFAMQSTNPSFASCATSLRYAISTSTQQGRNVLSAILAAKAAGQTIQVVGKNTCTANGDAEDINYIAVF
ncbi:MAG: hypothetical protein V4732_10560 [Pseudomonadota bacterium]